ncbi:glutathione S-transferase N-terminal domain-containing protein [Gammaproteobacteria bacterium]|nr:glutathione S-transferase N-terminal domain-containing protein [Gammaproteobacteria bacterium]|tara:strand:+ start:1005 stop:1652 length:648 start_codon:yes stop_codon:yes gene_type:complete
MLKPILYSFKRCPYAMRARIALKLANIQCELREVRLNNKPDHMLEISPKGTVPVLILEDKVIDESIEIINWVLDKIDVFKGNIDQTQIELTESLISIFDDKFKYHLDRYKYSNRYKDSDLEFHRNACFQILLELENIIASDAWIFGDKLNKLDISILPFIRQYKIADIIWFDAQSDINKVQKILNNFIDSSLFKEIMLNYEEWDEISDPIYFPSS